MRELRTPLLTPIFKGVPSKNWRRTTSGLFSYFAQLLDFFVQRGTVQRNIRFPGQHLETQLKPTFCLLDIARLYGRQFPMTAGCYHYFFKGLPELPIVKLAAEPH